MSQQIVADALEAKVVWFFEIRTPPLWNVMGWLRVDDAGRRKLGLPPRRSLAIEIRPYARLDKREHPPVAHTRGTGKFWVTDISKLFIHFAEAGAEFEENDGETDVARCPQEED